MNIHDPKQIVACQKDPKCSVPYHQPGSAGGYPPFSKSPLKSCPEMTARIRGENPTVTVTTFEGLCPYGTSKIALAVDPNEDYHFWRQDDTGWWSGKPGSMKVTDKDASGRRVYDPSLADRDFTDDNGELNYTEFCSFYCVPRNRALFMKTGGYRALSMAFSAKTSSPSGAVKSRRRLFLTRRFQDSKKPRLRRNHTAKRETRRSNYQ